MLGLLSTLESEESENVSTAEGANNKMHSRGMLNSVSQRESVESATSPPNAKSGQIGNICESFFLARAVSHCEWSAPKAAGKVLIATVIIQSSL